MRRNCLIVTFVLLFSYEQFFFLVDTAKGATVNDPIPIL